ncbi:MAG: glycoside hydrolase family 2 TIM barrel-domain containing protein [Erysipelotrichaceae bacterium]|nr:glycoside hydrolase family 2 TIM barrel-domain containing protein [Erysipelotrichaceae bacterium]
MRKINNHWEFSENWSDEFLNWQTEAETVRIPHTVKEIPLHYADHNSYQMVCGYRRKVTFDPAEKGMRHFLRFDGAAHIAKVWFNEKYLGEHRCGYTSFSFEITDLIDWDHENRIAVKLDTTENPEIPPFGFVIDYLTYGGIYRDVVIETKPEVFLDDLFVSTPDLKTVKAQLHYSGKHTDDSVLIEILDEAGTVYGSKTVTQDTRNAMIDVENVKAWSPDSPFLYICRVTSGSDVKEVTFGFRTVTLTENDIVINGNPVFLRGLNRHQCYPYSGYAVPDALQVEDARILKEELGVNAVRTSHYPQSHAFIDACDRLGLLVFTEIPGWQHLGDRSWKKQAIENTREMVIQYRNHPSIILWGVRINESMDDDEFYRQTNETAHRLDPTRPTTGVRYFEKSSLLEDVYSFNDFSHTGNNDGAKKKKDVTPDLNKPLIISEANGHMFPTKSFDHWQKRQDHALRHAKVLNDARSDGAHGGCFQWCMFDYPTHKDFGSGDRVCYHGVMDAFRNPKLAAAVYAAEGSKNNVLEISSPMDIGDYAGGSVNEIYAFTNADEVRLYKNDDYVATFRPQIYKGLEHGPILIDDRIGVLLETKEGFTGRKEKLIHDALNAAARYGMAGMPIKNMAELGWCMVRYGMKYEDGVELYGKYVGSWGGDATVWRFDGYKNGVCVSSVTKSPSCDLHFETSVSHTELHEGDTYDMAAVRIRILDGYNNSAVYAQLPLTLSVEGPLEIIGPHTVTAEGGMCGTYVRTTGKSGKAVLKIHNEQLEDISINFSITGEEI